MNALSMLLYVELNGAVCGLGVKLRRGSRHQPSSMQSGKASATTLPIPSTASSAQTYLGNATSLTTLSFRRLVRCPTRSWNVPSARTARFPSFGPSPRAVQYPSPASKHLCTDVRCDLPTCTVCCNHLGTLFFTSRRRRPLILVFIIITLRGQLHLLMLLPPRPSHMLIYIH